MKGHQNQIKTSKNRLNAQLREFISEHLLVSRWLPASGLNRKVRQEQLWESIMNSTQPRFSTVDVSHFTFEGCRTTLCAVNVLCVDCGALATVYI